MNSQQTLVTALGLVAILAGSFPAARAGALPDDQLSPAVRSERDVHKPARATLPDSQLGAPQGRTESTHTAKRSSFELSMEQMDKVVGGMINNDAPPPVPPYGSDGRGVTCRHIACYGL